MSRKFESADPLRRGGRRPPVSALRAAALRASQTKQPSDSPVQTPGPSTAGVADLTKKQPPASMQGSGFQEFALKMCTTEDVAEARYHVLKFHSKVPIDPAGQFVHPIRLHRKDPRQLQLLAGEEEENADVGDTNENAMEVDTKPYGLGAGSPSDGSAKQENKADPNAPPKRRPFGRKRKTRQIHGGSKNDAARKLRYEEHFPWVMEDFDNKNTWISSYEAAQTENHAMLTYDAASNGFKVIPIEKFYRMTAAAKYATLSLEDAEERMESAHSMRDRWLMSHLQPRNSTNRLPSPDQLGSLGPRNANISRMRTVVGSEERQSKFNMDEEMDYDDQEMFDDDEGAPILDGPEEDLKEAEDRIKREQRKANELMDAGTTQDIDELFDDDEAREGKQGKKLRKALTELEKNQFYDTDEEDNPYVSSPDVSDSDEELNAQTNTMTNGTNGEPTIKQEGDLDAHDGLVLPLSQFRKKHISRDSLPRGTVVLQLPGHLLMKFQPGMWNPNVKRESSTPVEEDPRLLTREDVRRNIKSGETDIKQLLGALKAKITQHKDNVPRLRQFVKEVARSKDRKLYLRAP